MTRIGTGPSNREILEDDLDGYPDSFDDLGLAPIPNPLLSRISDVFDSIKLLPDGWGNSIGLANLVYSVQFHPSLPEYDALSASLHDVYLVSVPHWGWPTSTRHWSFYSQGHFFHLRNKKCPKLGIDRVTPEEVESDMVNIRREIDSHTFHSTPGKKDMRLPLTAYNVGQTKFNAEQIEKLAGYIISQCKTYTLWKTNCHFFVLSLRNRTVMGKRDGTIFVGTKAQIIRWDRCLKNTSSISPFNHYDGFCFTNSAGHKGVSNRSGGYYFNLSGLISDGLVSRASVAIADLYRSGVESIGSFDPSGTKSQTAYAMGRLSRDVRKASRDFRRVTIEVVQDVMHGRFLDAVRGRKESNLKAYEEFVLEAKKGAKSTGKLLPLHKFLLSISDAEEREIRARVYGGDLSRSEDMTRSVPN